jgi:predicted TIM-barrel fold metal-dependent hydrolase
MQTPWLEMPVNDAHIHFFSRGFFSLLAKQKQSSVAEIMSTLGWKLPPEDPAELAAQWVAELDQVGVARAVMISSLPGDEASAAAAGRAFPTRLVPAAMVNPRDAAQASRLDGIRMICLFPAMHAYSLHDPAVTALLEATNGPVFVHCGLLSVGVRKKLGLPSPFDMRFSNPLDLHPIALRYPHRSFIVPHFGAGFWREALMLADLCPNVYLDTSSSNSWIRTQPGDVELGTVFRRTLAVTGPERLLFGTDSSFFPRGWHRAIFEQQLMALREIDTNGHAAKCLLGANFDRLFPVLG